MRAIQKTRHMRILLGGIRVAKHPRQQTDNRIEQNQCRQFATAHDVVPDRPLFVDLSFDQPFVYALITTCHQHQPGEACKSVDSLLIQQIALWA